MLSHLTKVPEELNPSASVYTESVIVQGSWGFCMFFHLFVLSVRLCEEE